jgi:hypothetical protein
MEKQYAVYALWAPFRQMLGEVNVCSVEEEPIIIYLEQHPALSACNVQKELLIKV